MNIKTIGGTLLSVMMVTLTSCSSDSPTPQAAPTETGTFVDQRDGFTYKWVRIGNLEWATENLHYQYGTIQDYSIYQYDSDEYNRTGVYDMRYFDKYGCLYTQAAAVKAVPEGWRVPTDKDWQNLEMTLGMSAKDAAGYEWRGNIAPLMLEAKSNITELAIRLGGYYTDHTNGGTSGWRFMGAWGFYWTSTRDISKESECYFYRRFAYNQDGVFRESMEPVSQRCYVRMVRNASTAQP